MLPSDADQIRDLEAELDELVDPTTADVLAHTKDYDAGIVAAIGVQRGTAGGGGGGSQSVETATIDVSAAEILASHDTPLELVPAQGAGTFIIPLTVAGFVTGGTLFYTIGGALQYQLGGKGSSTSPITDILTDFSPSPQVVYAFDCPGYAAGGSYATAENAPFLLGFTNANPTDGDLTLTIMTSYLVFVP